MAKQRERDRDITYFPQTYDVFSFKFYFENKINETHSKKLSSPWNVCGKEVNLRSFNPLRTWFDIVVEMLSLYILPSR